MYLRVCEDAESDLGIGSDAIDIQPQPRRTVHENPERSRTYCTWHGSGLVDLCGDLNLEIPRNCRMSIKFDFGKFCWSNTTSYNDGWQNVKSSDFEISEISETRSKSVPKSG